VSCQEACGGVGDGEVAGVAGAGSAGFPLLRKYTGNAPGAAAGNPCRATCTSSSSTTAQASCEAPITSGCRTRPQVPLRPGSSSPTKVGASAGSSALSALRLAARPGVSFRLLLLLGVPESRHSEVDGGSAEPASGVVVLGLQEGEGHVDMFISPTHSSACARVRGRVAPLAASVPCGRMTDAEIEVTGRCSRWRARRRARQRPRYRRSSESRSAPDPGPCARTTTVPAERATRHHRWAG
jgi:hypothetical protein